jgi:hypothetical protein
MNETCDAGNIDRPGISCQLAVGHDGAHEDQPADDLVVRWA